MPRYKVWFIILTTLRNLQNYYVPDDLPKKLYQIIFLDITKYTPRYLTHELLLIVYNDLYLYLKNNTKYKQLKHN